VPLGNNPGAQKQEFHVFLDLTLYEILIFGTMGGTTGSVENHCETYVLLKFSHDFSLYFGDSCGSLPWSQKAQFHTAPTPKKHDFLVFVPLGN
jgi:hypothetical protein